MRSSNPVADDASLRRLSRLMALFCLFLVVLFPSAVGWNWFSADPVSRVADLNLPGVTASSAVAWQVGVSGAFAVLPAVIVAVALLAARRCFLAFSRGDYLTMPAVRALRSFGLWMTIAAVAGVVIPTLTGLVMTLNNPEGQRVLMIGIDEQVLIGLLFGGTLWVMAAVMTRAVTIAEDNAQIV